MHVARCAVLTPSPDQRTALLDNKSTNLENAAKIGENGVRTAPRSAGQGPGPKPWPGTRRTRGWGRAVRGGGPGAAQWAKRMLDNTTPSQRSEMYEFIAR